MFELLDKLRSKPEGVRRAIAFWVSAGVVFFIVSIWLTALPTKLSQMSDDYASKNIKQLSTANEASVSGALPVGNIKPSAIKEQSIFDKLYNYLKSDLEYNRAK